MTCSKFPPMLSRYLDRESSPVEAAEVAHHLTACKTCRVLADSWQLQGTHLRAHLKRHTLGDDFVAKVLGSVSPQDQKAGGRATPLAAPRRLLRWLPAAAAVLIAVVLVSFYFSNRENIGYARVIDPGELELLHANAWVQATAGELLHAGEWMRNSQAGTPEVQIRNSFRITLEPGTLAHIPDAQSEIPDEVFLLRGAISTEIQTGGQEFRIHTPAGSVTSAFGRFSVRVGDIALPRLEIAADGSEIATGTILSIGEVKVLSGKARIRSAHNDREVSAGANTVFCESMASSPVAAASDSSDLPLRSDVGAAEKGSLVFSLTSISEGLALEVRANNISLKKMLEWTTTARVHGGDDRRVSGTLRLPVASSTESIASKIGSMLRVPISFRQETIRRSVAVGSLSPASAGDWAQGAFSLQKSRNGMISFDFQSVPADQAFRILRGAANDFPGIATESEALPVSLHGPAMKPEEATAWIGRTLGMQIKSADQQVDVIEVGPLSSLFSSRGPADFPFQNRQVQIPPGENPQASRVSPTSTDSRSSKPGLNSAPLAGGGRQMAAESLGPRPLWSILGGRMSASGFYVPPIPSDKISTDTGSVSAKKREILGGSDLVSPSVPSTHIIWPVFGRSGVSQDEAAYLVTNSLDAEARILWSGYDYQGALLSQFELTMNGSSTITLDPLMDFPTNVGPGGHWELAASVPLLGSRDSGDGIALGTPVVSEMLMRDRLYSSSSMNLLGAHLWMVNPTDAPVQILMSVARSGRVIATVPAAIPAHGGIIWPESPSGMPTRLPGAAVTIHALNGPIALGIDK